MQLKRHTLSLALSPGPRRASKRSTGGRSSRT